MLHTVARTAAALCLLLTSVGCGDNGNQGGKTLSRAELMNPETCRDCHADAYRQWASSMHAYASADPVFRAMNARGQEETDGALGDFCIQCHAPMAVADGKTVTGDNLDELGPEYQGVTCYFCHNVEGLEADHQDANNPLKLANDTTMRGSIEDPVRSPAHGVAYSEMFDGRKPQSTELCGTCHDIKTPTGVHLERTYSEWQSSLFSQPENGLQTCNACHMPGSNGPAAELKGRAVPSRRVHNHLFPGVDIAVTDFPDIDVQRAAIACDLSAAVTPTLVPNINGTFELRLEAQTAHGWPTGASQDRRAWVEFVAYDDAGEVIFESGRIGPGEPVVKPTDDPDFDRHLFVMYDRMFGADGEPVHMFWEAAPSDAHPTGIESSTLPVFERRDQDHSRSHDYPIGEVPARVTVKVTIRAMDVDVIDELIDGEYLDGAVRDRFEDVVLTGTVLDWSLEEDGWDEYRKPEPNPLDCPNDWRCQLDPDYPGCP